MKKRIGAVCVLAAALLLAGCGKSFEPTASSLYIQKDGKLTQAIVESFEQDFYSLDELKSMTEKEVDTYNQDFGEERVSVNRLEVQNETLYLLLDYMDMYAYSQYNDVFCFVGTIDEALDAGLSFDMVFKDTAYDEFTAAEATANKKNHVAVLKEEGMVELEQAVKYVSNNVEIIEDKLVQVMPIEDEDEYAYIIY